MTQFGSSRGMISQNLSQTVDGQGNPIISTDTTFGASPLGYAPLVQSLFGLPNATFQLTPPNTASPISSNNPLPYWDLAESSEGQMSGSAIYDTTTGTWGVNLSPGTAATASTLTFTTRSFLVNDDNLALRQKALAVVSKVGTYAGTSQWNMKLTASYYDHTDTLLHSGTVATIYDNTTWTSMSGTTTTGGTAINAAAVYVDLAFVITTTAAVTSATSVTIKSALLQTSSGATAGGAFQVIETFYSSGTFTVPTGVTFADILVVGGGGGGGGGGLMAGGTNTSTRHNAMGGGGGGGGAFLYAPNTNISGTSSYTISVGALGAGGTARTFSKGTGAVGQTGTAISGGAGAAGGATSFGTLVVASGGAGGGAGVGTIAATSPTPAGGVAGTPNFSVYSYTAIASGRGGDGGTASAAGSVNGGSSTLQSTGWNRLPYVTTYPGAGVAGGTATDGTAVTGATSGTATPTAGSGGGAGYFGGGGGAGASIWNPTASTIGSRNGGNGSSSGGGGGAGVGWMINGSSSGGTAVAGSGGSAAGTAGAGGGGGGGIFINRQDTIAQAFSLTSGAGGDGSQGFVIVAYTA